MLAPLASLRDSLRPPLTRVASPASKLAAAGGRLAEAVLAGRARPRRRAARALVGLPALPARAEFSDTTEWILGIGLLVGLLCQSGGFFLHLAAGEGGRPSVGMKLTRGGALLIAAALITLAVGLIQTA